MMRCIMATVKDDARAGTFTGGMQTGLINVRNVIRSIPGVAGVTIVFDAGVPAYREMALPGYKAHRPSRQPVPDEAYERAKRQIWDVQTGFRLLGARIFDVRGWEADDVIAECARCARDDGEQVAVVSSDRDLFQCFEYGAAYYSLSDLRLITPQEFDGYEDKKKPKGLPLGVWVLYRAMCGDSSDNIAGLPGVGPSTAFGLLIDAANDGVDLDGDPRAQAEAITPWLTRCKKADGAATKYAEALKADPELLLAGVEGISLDTKWHAEELKPIVGNLWRKRKSEFDREKAEDWCRANKFTGLVNDRSFFTTYRAAT